MLRVLSIIIALLTLTAQANATHSPLQSMLRERLMKTNDLPKMDLERTWGVSGFVPIQNIELRYGYNDIERGEALSYNPIFRKYNDSIRFRFKFKSPREMLDFYESRSVSNDLINIEKQEVVNQRQFEAYIEIVNQLLQSQMLKVFGVREGALQKSVERSGQILGLPKGDVKDLVKELERLQKVSAENENLKAQAVPKLGDKELEASSKALIDAIGELAKKVAQLDGQPLNIQRDRLVTRLQRIDKETGWANDRKILDHIDYQRNNLDKEDSIRIGFNIPFLRFDNENRARDKALLAVKESELMRKAEETTGELRRKRALVFGLAAQVETLKSRLGKTREISGKVRAVRDIELREVLSDFAFDLERDVLVQSLKFYNAYLEYLRDIGAFARMGNRNLLDPDFGELG